MTESKVKKFTRPVLRIGLITLSILLLIAISGNTHKLIFEYKSLTETGLNFFRIIKLQFPPVTNLIGPFGVYLGFWLVKIFGKLFSMAILISIILTCLFDRSAQKTRTKIVSFLIYVLLLRTLSYILLPSNMKFPGIVPKGFYEFFLTVFHRTGSIIILSVLTLSLAVFIIEPSNISAFIIGLFKTIKFIILSISRFLKALTAVFRKKKLPNPKAKKKSPKKRKKTPIVDYPDEEDIPLPPKQPVSEDRKPGNPQKENLPIPENDNNGYKKPEIEDFLSSVQPTKQDKEETEKNNRHISRILIEKLAEFSVEAEVVNVNIGPIITQYEIKPAPGIKVNIFHSLADDLALAIKATRIRIQAPIPGRGLVGIEVPNANRSTIYLKDILLSDEMKKCNGVLAFGLGKDIAGEPVVADLANMPHLLIAGATGSGKSVCVNSIICSLLLRTTPDELRLILIDPKRIELSGFQGIPHLVQEVVTDNERALVALNWAVAEMESRYELLQKYKVKNLQSYNDVIKNLKQDDPEIEDRELPYIVIVVDELADLMMTVGRDIERPITRLAQMARAIGIHLILATQRPSIKVITGVIKANFPSRIAFQVSTKVDSRVIIDTNGAEKLLGMGDSLFLPPGKGQAVRIHGAFILPQEIHNLIDYLKTQPKPEHEIKIIDEQQTISGDFKYDDELFPEAAVCVVTAGQASVSMLQRHFGIGYARAGRLIDMLEQAGIIGPHVGSKPREVIASEEDLKIYGYLPD
jgi:S-DNA-T family DNA segregation ATPase FtsK/SpoIIIE